MKNLKLKSLFVISAILVCNIIVVNAKTGVIDIIMKSSNGSNKELITIKAEANKLHSIILVSQTGEIITKTIRPTNQPCHLNFDLPAGKYQLLIVEVETGIKQNYTFILL